MRHANALVIFRWFIWRRRITKKHYIQQRNVVRCNQTMPRLVQICLCCCVGWSSVWQRFVPKVSIHMYSVIHATLWTLNLWNLNNRGALSCSHLYKCNIQVYFLGKKRNFKLDYVPISVKPHFPEYGVWKLKNFIWGWPQSLHFRTIISGDLILCVIPKFLCRIPTFPVLDGV